ncbi:cysteine desulfurase [Microbacterium endophyticum]|uniref:Cysteine desulfurase n=1 Tax=Microbacterium endophyticum TaxID=1526412 RepID=A0A7W4V1J6_9MICO|nr:cysteine desulfurase family protein [Microbacterium endophyticum]MBB2974600.1 cysteine desulfurase [Microbacterium endophyticum]NIK36897.1 cysteine desulfurase [Microbacterium endophyticum]
MSVYLDHAATSPLRPEARDAWLAAVEVTGNASSIHGSGQSARRLLEESREMLAGVLHCDPVEVLFTSGGTESINLAIKGLWWERKQGGSILLPDGEHHATMDAANWLMTHDRAEVRAVSLDGVGRISLAEFAGRLPGASLATALVANNEVGTVNDVSSLSELSAEAGVPLHLDAVAAFGHIPISFNSIRADAGSGVGLVALSVSAHKVGGPVGVGALVAARSAELSPLQHGGGQQRGLRAGTQDIAGAAAFAAAAVAAEAERDSERARLLTLTHRVVRGVQSVVPDAVLLGDATERIPGNANFLFPRAHGETLLFLLDQAGISVSTGSACQAGVAEPSHVVRAIGRSETDARSVLRISLGRTTTPADVDELLAALPIAHERAAASRSRADARS